MFNAPLALDVAHSLMRERQRQAEHEALVRQVAAAQRDLPVRRAPAAARRLLAGGLRHLAVWLDPTLEARPAVAVLSSSR